MPRKLVLGVGIRERKSKLTDTDRKCYSKWYSMLERCYSDKYPSYHDIHVCDEWLYYDNFEEWFILNYIDGYHLDKDILHQGNKVYSPDKCTFIPPQINTLIVDQYTKLPGITKSGKGYRVRVSKYGCDISIGSYEDARSAYEAYLKYKKEHIVEVATEYYEDNKIDESIYNSLLNWDINSPWCVDSNNN